MPYAVLCQSFYLDASTNISKSLYILWYSFALASSLIPYWHQWSLNGPWIIPLNLSFRAFRHRRQAKLATAHQAQGLDPFGRISLTQIDLQLLGTIRIRGVVAFWQLSLFSAGQTGELRRYTLMPFIARYDTACQGFTVHWYILLSCSVARPLNSIVE